jgi:hypothetical protein
MTPQHHAVAHQIPKRFFMRIAHSGNPLCNHCQINNGLFNFLNLFLKIQHNDQKLDCSIICFGKTGKETVHLW